jgi:hypothetical protein
VVVVTQRIEVPFFKGLNSSHTREIVQLSEVQNVVFENGSLKSRGSFTTVPNTKAKFICSTASGTLIASSQQICTSPIEFGKRVLYLLNGSLMEWKGNLPVNIFDGFTYKQYKIGVNLIDERNIYFIPSFFEKIIIYAGDIIFGFGRNEPSRLYFNSRYAVSGTTFEEMEASFKLSNPLYWKKNDFISVSGDILDVVAIQSHLYIVTENGCYRFVGENATNFSLTFANSICGVRGQTGVVINDNYYYKSSDNKIYRYSGTTPTIVSQNIQEELDNLKRSNARFEKCDAELWVIFDGSTYVFDTSLGVWTCFNFKGTVLQYTTSSGDFLYAVISEQVYLYDKHSKKGKDDFSNQNFITSFSIGFFDFEGKRLRLKNIMINIEEKTNNSILTINGISYPATLFCVGYSDRSNETTLIPDSKEQQATSTLMPNMRGMCIRRSGIPRFYRFKSRLKGRSLKVVIASPNYLDEVQKIILELRVR